MSSPTTTAGAPPVIDLRGRSPWSVLPPLVLGFFMIMVDTTIVNVAVPSLQHHFDAGVTAVGWVNSAYLLSFAVLMLFAGRLGDRLGGREVFVAGLVLFTLSSVWCGLSGSISTLIIARFVQGIGGALMTPQTMAVITRVFPPLKRGAAMGVWGAVAGIATIAGPVLGGFFVELGDSGWRWIFFVNIPIGIVALLLSVRFIPHLPTRVAYFDWLGVALSIVGFFALIFGLQEGESYDWGHVWGPFSVWSLIIGGLVLIAAFVWWQSRLGDRALLPLRLFRVRNFSLANVTGMAVTFSMIGIFFPLTIFLQSIMGLSPLHAALVNLPGSLISGIVAPFAGRLSDRISGKWVVATGFLVIGIAMGWLALILDPTMSVAAFVAPMCVFGLGTGLIFSPMANLATSGLDHSTAGAGAGAFNANRQVGGVIGSAAIIAVLTGRLASLMPDEAVKASLSLPEEYRASFVEQLSKVDLTASAGGFDLPSSIPDSARAAIEAAGNQAFHGAFQGAVQSTLLLVVGVLLLGCLSALAMRRTSKVAH